MANKDEYINVAELKKKLNYIYRANGVSKFTREAINSAICKLPFVLKSELETTLETTLKTIEFTPNSKDIEDIQRDAVINFANELMCNLDGDIETYANAGHSLNVYVWLKSYLESKGAIKAEPELFGNLELMKGEW